MDAARELFVVEFFHAHFGWLEYEHEFASNAAATNWLNCHPSPYRQRVRKVAEESWSAAPSKAKRCE